MRQKISAWDKSNTKQYSLEIDYQEEHLEYDLNGIPYVKSNQSTPAQNQENQIADDEWQRWFKNNGVGVDGSPVSIEW